MEKEDYIY